MHSKTRLNHLIRSTGILMAAFLANKILAIGRQIVIARAFGTGGNYDAFVAAFRLPDILFMLIAGGALGTAFIPILSERLTRPSEADPEGWRLTSGVLNTLLFLAAGLSALGAIFALPLVQWLVAPGFSLELQLLTANLMRLTLISTMVSSPLGPIAIRSARRPLGSGTSHIAKRSCRQNSRVTPRATSAAIGGPSRKQSGIGLEAIPRH